MTHDPAAIPEPTRSGRGLRNRSVLVAAAGLAVLVSAGCSGGAKAGETFTHEVTIAAVPGVDTAPLYLAQKDGFFTAQGMTNVVIKDYSSESAALSALQGGQADIAASDYGDIFDSQAHKTDLRVLADGWDASQGVLEIVSYPGSGVSSPADLQNLQAIGAPDDEVLSVNPSHTGPVSLEIAAADQVLFNYLGNSVDTISWRPLSQTQELTELGSHQLKAALLTQPYIYEAQSEFGATEVVDAFSGSTAALPVTGYVATDSWVNNNRAAVADFQVALGQAMTQASMSGTVQDMLKKMTIPGGMSVQIADLSTLGTYPTATNATALQRDVQLLWSSPSTISAFRGLNAPNPGKLILKPAG